VGFNRGGGAVRGNRRKCTATTENTGVLALILEIFQAMGRSKLVDNFWKSLG
jgi:hypothetical protein